MAIGNTGCGKSTMLNSLILGPECLEETQQESKIIIKIPNGKEKIKVYKTSVIDLKPEFKNDDNQYFGVGHSNSQSETFMPQFIEAKNTHDRSIEPNY